MCKRCIRECSFNALESKCNRIVYKGGCVACQRCAAMCPNHAIEIRALPPQMAPHATFTDRVRQSITTQASTGGVLLSSCGNDLPYDVIFDDIVLDAAQVTNPSIDPLREPIETVTYLGRRSGRVAVDEKGCLTEGSGPIVAMDMPLMLGHVSLGAVSYNTQKALFMAAQELNVIAG